MGTRAIVVTLRRRRWWRLFAQGLAQHCAETLWGNVFESENNGSAKVIRIGPLDSFNNREGGLGLTFVVNPASLDQSRTRHSERRCS